jgi:superoxide dismutase, Cu-Zn family
MSKAIKAIAVITNKTVKKLNGHILFEEDLKNKQVKITIKLNGISQGNHGFHIHESGDLRNSCKSLCSHYNPFNKKHGGPEDKERHVGDLGNIKANAKGIVSKTMYDKVIKLRGKYSIIGRSVVIHEKEDDLGKGDSKDSHTTGNAGSRIGCGVIGLVV